MKDTQWIMGMPITVEIVDDGAKKENLEELFNYFHAVDERFSTYKDSSEISKINQKILPKEQWSEEMKEIFELSAQTYKDTHGFFNIEHEGVYDPSGIVKGWAINNASLILHNRGFKNYYVEAGGDIQVSGKNAQGENWKIGIRNPFNRNENIKIVTMSDGGIATSGTYIRGQHIYNPFTNREIKDIVSLTIIGPNVLEADRYATAAFAMGEHALAFIEKIPGLEGYMVDAKGIAKWTNGFDDYILG